MYPDSTALGQLPDSDQLCVCQSTTVPAYFKLNSHHHSNSQPGLSDFFDMNFF